MFVDTRHNNELKYRETPINFDYNANAFNLSESYFFKVAADGTFMGSDAIAGGGFGLALAPHFNGQAIIDITNTHDQRTGQVRWDEKRGILIVHDGYEIAQDARAVHRLVRTDILEDYMVGKTTIYNGKIYNGDGLAVDGRSTWIKVDRIRSTKKTVEYFQSHDTH